MEDYIKKYAKKGVTRHQDGGPVAPEQGAMPAGQETAPAEQGGGDLQTMLMQAYQSQDPQMALQVVNMIVEQMQAGQGGQEQGGAMPAARNGMRLKSPIFRKGGKLKV